jgi:hypothetical protein
VTVCHTVSRSNEVVLRDRKPATLSARLTATTSARRDLHPTKVNNIMKRSTFISMERGELPPAPPALLIH